MPRGTRHNVAALAMPVAQAQQRRMKRSLKTVGRLYRSSRNCTPSGSFVAVNGQKPASETQPVEPVEKAVGAVLKLQHTSRMMPARSTQGAFCLLT